jgi:hypothetical protein
MPRPSSVAQKGRATSRSVYSVSIFRFTTSHIAITVSSLCVRKRRYCRNIGVQWSRENSEWLFCCYLLSLINRSVIFLCFSFQCWRNSAIKRRKPLVLLLFDFSLDSLPIARPYFTQVQHPTKGISGAI